MTEHFFSSLKAHIRWADDLARASGVPSECVYPPDRDE